MSPPKTACSASIECGGTLNLSTGDALLFETTGADAKVVDMVTLAFIQKT
jgi:hypothetical protein